MVGPNPTNLICPCDLGIIKRRASDQDLDGIIWNTHELGQTILLLVHNILNLQKKREKTDPYYKKKAIPCNY